MAELDIEKKYLEKKKIKRIELEYKDLNYIIINLEESVIDVNGELYEVHLDEYINIINEIIWSYENLDEFVFWPDKSKDHKPMSPMWRIAWYDEADTYYHKSGALKYPDRFMELIKILKELPR